MRKIDLLLNEYGESHRNATNKAIHWLCVPLIFWSIVALLYSLPFGLAEHYPNYPFYTNWAFVALLAVSVYYLRLSIPLALGMFAFSWLCLFVAHSLSLITAFPLWQIAVGVFVLAWIGQFYGHKIEGKKPSFLKDLQFLLIGPAWLMHFIFKRINLKY